MGVTMMSTLRNATDTVTASVGDAVEAVRGQIDAVTGHRRRRRRRGAVWIIVVAVGVMAWRAWSRHTAEAPDKKNRDATSDHRWDTPRDQNGGAGKTANTAEHNADRVSTDKPHADKQTSS